MSLIPLEVRQSSTPFIFSFSILIPSGPITTAKNPTSLTFYLHFSGFIYKSFSANLLTIFPTILSYLSSSSIPTITLLMKLAASPVLIKFYKILLIIVWNIAGEFISPKNITIGSNNPSGVMNAAFYLSLSFICTLL